MSTTDPHEDAAPLDDAGGTRLDTASLVAGVVFLAMALAFAIADLDSLEDQVRYVWPVTLLAIGAGMLLATRRNR